MKKSIISTLLIPFLFTSLGSCGSKPVDKDISIIYTSDVHCGVDDNLGYSSVEAYKKSLEETNYVALVDSGDYLQGEYLGAISKGKYLMEIINEMNYDVITLGDHEFDYGIDTLKERLNEFNGSVVSSNYSYIGNKENKLDMVKPYVIKKYGSKKIAFIGITTPKTLNTVDPKIFKEDGEVAYSFAGETSEGFYNKIQASIDECKAKKADYIIALSHLGNSNSFSPFSSIDVIKNTNGVTAFLDGHSHTDLAWTTYKNKDDVDTLLVNTGYKLNKFASLTISKDGNITYELIDKYDTKDEHMSEFITSIKEKAKEEGSKVVTTTDIALEANLNYLKTREASIGDLIADAYRYYGEADIGVINSNSIASGLNKGEVTYEKIMNVHPFEYQLMKKKVLGSKIRDYLEFASMKISDVPEQNPFNGFAQVSGLKFSIDTRVESTVTTTETGDFVSVGDERRVKDIKVLINGTYVDLEDEKTYTIASSSFLLENGGDSANMFTNDETIATSSLLSYQVLINYIVDVLHGELSTNYSTSNKRIIIEPTGGDDGSVITISKEMLYNTKLIDYCHPNKEYNKGETDKKFTIDIGNGKTIQGAIIFRDCAYQYVGNNLLDVMGIKNKEYNSVAYNFNILFFFDKLTRFEISYTVHSTEYNWIDQQIKFGDLDSTDFYSSLGDVPYDWITERAGGGYGKRLFPGGDMAGGNDFVINSSTRPDTITRAYGWSLTDKTCNLVGYNLTYAQDTLIGNKGELDFKINSLIFYYSAE